jgi:transketolase N-terminal domain/subunit
VVSLVCFFFFPTWVSYLLNKERYTRPLVNGVSLANGDKTVFCLGSDGSQQEGNDAEAARLAVAQGLNVKLLIDDNDVTLAGHPSEYLKGYDVSKTLEGHELKVVTVQGEDIDSLWSGICAVVTYQGPAAGMWTFHE